MPHALAVVAVLLAFAPGGRAADHCCVTAGLSADYDAASTRIGAHWGTPVAGAAAVELRVSDRLDASGIADASSSRSIRVRVSGGSASVGAGPVKTVLAAHAGVFVQVRFACSAPAPGPCATGAFWSKPVHVTAEGSRPAGGSDVTTSQHRVRIVSNGTQACRVALDDVRKLIKALNANTAAAQEAAAAHRSTARYVRLQEQLKREFATAYAHAQTACARR